MILENNIIEFKGMPLFQKARFKTPFTMEGKILDFACFFYMIEGSMVSFDSRGSHVLNEKEAIIKNCNNYVQRYVPAEGKQECEAIAVYLYPELLKEIYKDEVPSFLKKDKVPMPKRLISNKLIEQYMTNLSIYFEEPDTLDEELGILKLKELMMILLKSENHQNVRQLLSEIFAPINTQFKQAVASNLYNNLSVEQLAFICNMSLSTFKREFTKVYDTTPAKYIKHKRLEKAATLLGSNNGAISEVAFDSGFQDVTTFSASFQDKYNVSPSKFRLNQNRN
jgi:AraC-like DNA-binding protein